jgi:hypothetical protein
MDKILIGFWVCFLGSLMYFYIFMLSVFDPDRLHILHHENEEEDSHYYFKAWFTSLLCFITYGTGASILGYLKYFP